MPNGKDIGIQIRRLRTARGMSQEKLARQLDVSGHTVGQWERGKQQPRLLMRKRIQEVLGGTDDELQIPQEADLPTPPWVREIIENQRRMEATITRLEEKCCD